LNEAFLWSAANHWVIDPDSYDWDPLDGELSKKLDTQPYVSMSRERAPQDARPFPDIDPDVDETELSLFDINMPGVLTLEEVKALDLDHWYLLYHGSFVQMDVSIPSLSD
jgi:arginine-tRNA-protein transferase